jgi:hypothetical protein
MPKTGRLARVLSTMITLRYSCNHLEINEIKYCGKGAVTNTKAIDEKGG